LALVTIVSLSVLDRNLALVRRVKPFIGLPLLGALSLPWLAAVWTIDGGTLYRGMGWRTVLDALEGGQDMKFKTIHGVFVLTLLLGFVPITHMLGPVVARAWHGRHDPTLRFLLVWLIAPIIALELLSNKPPLYTVQAVMPAGALLVAMAVTRGSPHQFDVKSWPGMFVGTGVLLLVVAPVLFGGILWATSTPFSPILAVTFAIFASLFLLAAWLSAHGHGFGWLTIATFATMVFGIWFNGLLMPGLRNFWTAPQITALAHKLDACNAGPLSVAGFREPSLSLAHGPTITPERAAAIWASSKPAAIESRQIARFMKVASDINPDVKPQSAGCIRSLNLARGCSLLFQIYVPSTKPASCGLDLPKDCTTGHEFLKSQLNIDHCD